MWHELGITKTDWDCTPPAVRIVLLSLHHQLRLMDIRFTAYEKQSKCPWNLLWKFFVYLVFRIRSRRRPKVRRAVAFGAHY